MPHIIQLFALLFVCVCTPNFAQAVIVFAEPTDGILSADNMAPTDLTGTPLVLGSNEVHGTIQGAQSIGNIDVFTLLVPNGFVLAKLVVNDYQAGSPSNPFDTSFIGIDAGSQFRYNSVDLDDVDFGFLPFDFLGGTTFGGGSVGDDLFPAMSNIGLSFGNPFNAPLGPGDYTFYVQQKSNAITTYELDFQLASTAASVPEPSSAVIWLAGCYVFGLRRQRKSI